MSIEIFKYLKSKGIKTHTKGYTYIADALEIIIQNKAIKQKMHEEIYQVIADNYNITMSKVERAIRYARVIAGYDLMSNSEFLYDCAVDILYNKDKGNKQ